MDRCAQVCWTQNIFENGLNISSFLDSTQQSLLHKLVDGTPTEPVRALAHEGLFEAILSSGDGRVMAGAVGGVQNQSKS